MHSLALLTLNLDVVLRVWLGTMLWRRFGHMGLSGGCVDNLLVVLFWMGLLMWACTCNIAQTFGHEHVVKDGTLHDVQPMVSMLPSLAFPSALGNHSLFVHIGYGFDRGSPPIIPIINQASIGVIPQGVPR